MSGEGGGVPESWKLLPAAHFPALPGASEAHSYFVSYTFMAMGIIILLAIIMKITLKLAPKGVQNLMEWLVELVEEQGKGIFGEGAMRYLPFFATLFLFILISNLMGLIPGFVSPTASYHTNFAMAISVAILTQWAGVRTLGLKGYLKHFVPPDCPWWIKWPLMSWMWPMLEIVSQFVRPISLTMRLFGNIYAKEMLLGMLAFLPIAFLDLDGSTKVLSALPFALRIFIVWLGTLVSIVQASVFTILAMVYVSMAIQHHEESAEGHEGHGGHGH
jgi:F-type H+-transporting ATPase subunit a